jgi:hypothetical protein
MYEEEEDGNSAIPVHSPGLLVALLYVLMCDISRLVLD